MISFLAIFLVVEAVSIYVIWSDAKSSPRAKVFPVDQTENNEPDEMDAPDAVRVPEGVASRPPTHELSTSNAR